MSKIIGIDLGTTNSVVAGMEGGDPTVIATAEGGGLCPSVVACFETERGVLCHRHFNVAFIARPIH